MICISLSIPVSSGSRVGHSDLEGVVLVVLRRDDVHFECNEPMPDLVFLWREQLRLSALGMEVMVWTTDGTSLTNSTCLLQLPRSFWS